LGSTVPIVGDEDVDAEAESGATTAMTTTAVTTTAVTTTTSEPPTTTTTGTAPLVGDDLESISGLVSSTTSTTTQVTTSSSTESSSITSNPQSDVISPLSLELIKSQLKEQVTNLLAKIDQTNSILTQKEMEAQRRLPSVSASDILRITNSKLSSKDAVKALRILAYKKLSEQLKNTSDEE